MSTSISKQVKRTLHEIEELIIKFENKKQKLNEDFEPKLVEKQRKKQSARIEFIKAMLDSIYDEPSGVYEENLCQVTCIKLVPVSKDILKVYYTADDKKYVVKIYLNQWGNSTIKSGGNLVIENMNNMVDYRSENQKTLDYNDLLHYMSPDQDYGLVLGLLLLLAINYHNFDAISTADISLF